VEIGAVLGGEVHIDAYVGFIDASVGFGVVHERGQLGDTRPQLIGHLALLVARGVGIALGEGGADPDRDDAALGLASSWQTIAIGPSSLAVNARPSALCLVRPGHLAGHTKI
jgi:hypothetical protein